MMKRITAFVLAALLILASGVAMAADEGSSQSDTSGASGSTESAPDPFVLSQVFDASFFTPHDTKSTIFSLSSIRDVCTSADGRIFIAADITENRYGSSSTFSRVYVLNSDGSYYDPHTETGIKMSSPFYNFRVPHSSPEKAATGTTQAILFGSPNEETENRFGNIRGLFYDNRSDELYVADTSCNRILVFDGKTLLAKRAIYRPDTMTGDIEFNPVKIAVNSTGHIYVIISTSYRGIIELNPDGSFSRYFGESEEFLTFAEEFYRQQANELYIADAANERIVVLMASNLLLKHFIYRPDNMPDDAEFKPDKVAVDSAGRIYVTVQDSYEGNFVLNPDGSFSRFFNGADIRYYYPSPFFNVTVDSQDYIMAVKGAEDAPQKMYRMNANGENLLSELSSTPEEKNVQLIDITVRPDGIYAVLDENRYVFLYGADNQLIGCFSLPIATFTSIAWHGENLLISDYTGMLIYEPTDYGLTLLNASEDSTPITQ